ncbi:MAG: SDR family oxidoreductase [Blastocatellia bacterium]|nr:SDR family oxidoreductase [Blastocatellia bacterium]
MNLLIFGASGGTGRCLLEQALAQGHHVTAFARKPENVAVQHPSLKVVQGDMLDYDSVATAMPGHDAVLSTLGVYLFKKNTVLSDGTRNIIRAMEAHGVKRFVCETALGISDSRDQLSLFVEFIFYPFLLRHFFPDKERQELAIRQSSLDWIIVRPARLTNGKQTGQYRHGFGPHEKIKGSVSRADTAEFMLKQLTDDTYLRKTPGLSY